MEELSRCEVIYDTAAGVALCAVAFTVGYAPGDDVRCMNVDETASALGRLIEQDWRDWSLDDFRPFYAFGREEEIRDKDYEEGLAGIIQDVADCCETCAICSWPAMDLESNYNYGMEVWHCTTDLGEDSAVVNRPERRRRRRPGGLLAGGQEPVVRSKRLLRGQKESTCRVWPSRASS